MLTLEGKKFCICEAILMLDAKVWKENRKAWFNVVVEGIMKDYESKKTLAQVIVLLLFANRLFVKIWYHVLQDLLVLYHNGASVFENFQWSMQKENIFLS